MAGPKEIRPPAVAGLFYPADAETCRAQAQEYLAGKHSGLAAPCGAVVPHAGWICSGAIAGEAIAALRRARSKVDLVVVFAAVHTPLPLDRAALDDYAAWDTPLDAIEIAQSIRARFAGHGDWFATDFRFHRRDHAVEVELPLIRIAFPDAAVVPVEVPLIENAAEIGALSARCLADARRQPLFLASSDLTHYGPGYEFTPAGVGESALRWALRNDRRLLDRIVEMDVDGIVEEVQSHHNACGGGAIAAMLAACREFGATGAELLTHTNSHEVLSGIAPQPPTNAVGYASMVVG